MARYRARSISNLISMPDLNDKQIKELELKANDPSSRAELATGRAKIYPVR